MLAPYRPAEEALIHMVLPAGFVASTRSLREQRYAGSESRDIAREGREGEGREREGEREIERENRHLIRTCSVFIDLRAASARFPDV